MIYFYLIYKIYLNNFCFSFIDYYFNFYNNIELITHEKLTLIII